MTFTQQEFALGSCNQNELNHLNSSDSIIPPVGGNTENYSNINNNLDFISNNFSDQISCVGQNDEYTGDIISPNCSYYSVEEFKTKFSSLNCNLNILHNNLNGLVSKFDYFHQFIVDMDIFDIIAVTETSQKVSNNDFPCNVEIRGFNIFSTPSNYSKGTTVLYVKNNLKFRERTDLNSFNDTHEAIWVEIVNNSSKNTICASIYRHHNEDVESYDKFLEYMESCIQKLLKENKNIFICGDFNSDWLKIDKVSNYRKFYELMNSYSLLPQITQPTRIASTSATIIDNIFTNVFKYNLLSGNITTDFSDHFSQFLSVPGKKNNSSNESIYRRDYSRFSIESFRDDVSIQIFDNNLTDVNDQFGDFFHRLEGCLNRHAPMRKLSKKEAKLDQKPWITTELRKMIRIKNKLFNRKKRQKNNIEIARLYNLFRNRVVREMKKSKKKYFSDYFKQNSNDIKKQWDGIRSIINSRSNKNSNINELKISNKVVHESKEIANELNKFFSNVGPNTERSLPQIPSIKPEKYLKNVYSLIFL